MDGRKDCLIMLRDDVEWTTPDNIFIKGMLIPNKGAIVSQHSHVYAHTSLVAKGSVRVWKEGILLGDFSAPSQIFIEAKAFHKFQALEDDTAVYCIHNVEGKKVEIHEPVKGAA